MFEPIISAVFFFTAFVAALSGFLFGMRKKWPLTVIKIANTLIATIVSVFVTKLILEKCAGSILEFISNNIPSSITPDFKALADSPEISGSLNAILAMMFAPLLFYVVFLIAKILLGLIKAPIARLWINKKEDNKTWNYNESNYDKWGKKKLLEHKKFRMSSALLGAFSGFLLFFVLAVPAVFGLSITGRLAKPLMQNMQNRYTEMAVDFCDAATDNKALMFMEVTGGATLYDSLTSYDINGHKATLESEINFIADTTDVIIQLTKGADRYDKMAADAAIDNMSKSFNETTVMPSIISGVLSAADSKWDKGETFFGAPRLSLPGSFSPISDAMYDILSGGDIDAMKADLNSIFKIIGIINEDIPLTSLGDNPLALIEGKQTSTRIFETLYESGRLYTLVPAFAECGINLMADTLNFRQDVNAHYNSLTEEILLTTQNVCNGQVAPIDGESAPDTRTDTEKLTEELRKLFHNYGVDVKSDSCLSLAVQLIQRNTAGTLNIESVVQLLAETEIVVIESDEVTESTVILTADVYAEKTQLIFVEDITINYEKPADPKKEAALLSDAFATVATVAGKTATEGFDPKNIIGDFGRLIDCFDATHTFGTASSQNLLICVLQSQSVIDSLNTDLIQVTHLANNICNSAKDESYTTILENVVRTINIIESASKSEDIVADVEDLIMNMTPATSTTLQQFVTPDNMLNYGVPEQSAEQTSDLVSNVFGNLSDAKESGELTEEEYAAEAEAVADIINIAMNATKTNEDGTQDSPFKDEQSVSDFVDRVSDSKVMSQTIIEAVYDEEGNKTVDPLNTGVNLNDNEKAELVNAMNSNLAGTSDEEKEEKQKVLLAAAALVNVEVEIDENGNFVLPTNFPFN